MDRNLRILVVSSIEWSNENAFGNTVSNFFRGMQGASFASIYCRMSQPNNEVCSIYYSITAPDILRHLFTRNQIGKCFLTNSALTADLPSINRTEAIEKKLIQVLKKQGRALAVGCEEALFRTGLWKNESFSNFVREFDPNIIFTFVTSSEKVYSVICESKRLVPACKCVFFVVDDVYGSANAKGKQIIEKLIMSADLLYGESEMLCDDYQKRFHVPFSRLKKGCRFDGPIQEKTRRDERATEIVYAGNLYYGRADVLAALIRAMQDHNATHERRFHLTVFSGSPVPTQYQSLFFDDSTVSFLGQKPFEEVRATLREADLALHVESFEEKWKQIVRYSYSTKITDCLESGSVLLAIGPAGIASIEEVRHIPGAIVADNLDDLCAVLRSISSMDLYQSALSIRQYAIENFSIEKTQERLRKDLIELVAK